MGFMDLFARRPSLEEGLERMREVPDAVLLDVRTPEEYQAGHLPGARNMPLDRLDPGALPEGKVIFAYCRSGARSGQACAALERAGFEAVNLGGILGYRGELAY